MVRITAKVDNNLHAIAAGLSGAIATAVREQVLATERDVKLNIVAYDYIDTGNALGSVRGEANGSSGEVSINAESEDGFPYPWVGNYGSVHQSARPFFTNAEKKAEREFPGRVNRHVGRIVP